MISSISTESESVVFTAESELDSAVRLKDLGSPARAGEFFSVENIQVGADGVLIALTSEEAENIRVQKWNTRLAVIVMNMHAIFFAASNIQFKYLKRRELCTGDLFLFRSIVIVSITTLQMYRKKSWPTALRPQVRWLIARVFVGLSAYGCFKITIGFLPLSLLMIVSQTNPFWTSVLSYLLIGEKM